MGNPWGLTFDVFGNDLIALLDRLGVERAVIGGISMGAGVALNVAVRYPERVAGLVLSRPAVAEFEASDDYRGLLASSPDTAQSLRGQLTNERAVAAAARLECLPADRPLADLRAAAAIRVPALLLAHQQDPIHRFAFGESLARAIPGARLVELTPKSIARARHAAEVQARLDAFLSPFTAAGAACRPAAGSSPSGRETRTSLFREEHSSSASVPERPATNSYFLN